MLDHDVNALFVRDLANFFGNLLLVVIDAVIRAERSRLCRALVSSPAVVITRQ